MGLSSNLPPGGLPHVESGELASALAIVDASQREKTERMHLTSFNGRVVTLTDQAISSLEKSGKQVEKLSTAQIIKLADSALKSLGAELDQASKPKRGKEKDHTQILTKTLTAFRIAEHTYEIAQREGAVISSPGKDKFFASIHTPRHVQSLLGQVAKMRGKPLDSKECRILENFLKKNPNGSLETIVEILKFFDEMSPEKLRVSIESRGLKMRDEVEREHLQNGYQRTPRKRDLGIRDYLTTERGLKELDAQFKKDCLIRGVVPFSIRYQNNGKWEEISLSEKDLQEAGSSEAREKMIVDALMERLGNKQDVEQWLPAIKLLMTQTVKASSLGSPAAVCTIRDAQGNPAKGDLALVQMKVSFDPLLFTIHKAKSEDGEDRVTSIDYSSKWTGTPAFSGVSLGEKAVSGELSLTLIMPKEGATLASLQNHLSR